MNRPPRCFAHCLPRGHVSGFGRPGAADMRARGVHLEYSFQPDDQHGADVHNPLFELLSAVREHGSIQHAAKALGASYRHVWGALRALGGRARRTAGQLGAGPAGAADAVCAAHGVGRGARARTPGAAHRGAARRARARAERSARRHAAGDHAVRQPRRGAAAAARARRRRASAARGAQVRRQRRCAACACRRALRGGGLSRAAAARRRPAVRKEPQAAAQARTAQADRLRHAASGPDRRARQPAPHRVAARPGARRRAVHQPAKRFGHAAVDRSAAADRAHRAGVDRRLRRQRRRQPSRGGGRGGQRRSRCRRGHRSGGAPLRVAVRAAGRRGLLSGLPARCAGPAAGAQAARGAGQCHLAADLARPAGVRRRTRRPGVVADAGAAVVVVSRAQAGLRAEATPRRLCRCVHIAVRWRAARLAPCSSSSGKRSCPPASTRSLRVWREAARRSGRWPPQAPWRTRKAKASCASMPQAACAPR